MASTITAGNATNGLALSCDNTGILELKTGTGSGTTAVTIGTGQEVAVTLGSAAAPSITFSGDTNTGIFSPGADRIGFAEGGTQVGEFDASGNFLFNSGYGSTAVAYGCRAWVNFNGTGTVAIRASGNVTSITDNGTGDYTVNFTNAMPDANYAAVAGVSLAAGAATFVNVYSALFVPAAPTTTAMRFQCSSHTSAVGKDAEYATVSIFR
jgi:hypothetical protein